MEILKINARVLKAAMMFQAKSDVREWLIGVHITPGRVWAADGRVMFVAECPSMQGLDGDGIIIKIQGSIPSKAGEALIYPVNDEGVGLIKFTQLNSPEDMILGGEVPVLCTYTLGVPGKGGVSGGFQRVIDQLDELDKSEENLNSGWVGMNPGFFAKVSGADKALNGGRNHGVKIQIRSPIHAVECEFQTRAILETAKAYLMPMTL
jgi:hypothetical protein